MSAERNVIFKFPDFDWVWFVIAMILIIAIWNGEEEKAQRQAAIRKCYALGGVPILSFWIEGVMTDCKFKDAQ